MTEYREQPTNVGGSTSNGVSPCRGRVRLRLALADNSEGLILNLWNVYYLPNSPCNLVSLGLLNDSGIYYNNECETLYHVDSKRVLAQAQLWRNSYLLKPLNLSDGAVHLLKIDGNDYQWPAHALRSSSEPSAGNPLSTWHKRLGHPNFPSLKAYLNRLNISYTDDSSGYICDSCLRAKATKTYCRDALKRSERPYQFIHRFGQINQPWRFLGERYFFTFTDDATRMTGTYTGTKRSDWLKCLKAYHGLCRTHSKDDHPIQRLRSDYGSELQSHKADEWMEKEGIIFEPSAP